MTPTVHSIGRSPNNLEIRSRTSPMSSVRKKKSSVGIVRIHETIKRAVLTAVECTTVGGARGRSGNPQGWRPIVTSEEE